MPTEYEAKVLDIDPDSAAATIVAGGGQYHGERLMRRYVYDIAPGDQTRWIRLRDDGTRTTLTVKHIRHDGIDGTDEWELEVDDFTTANALLAQLGYQPKSYQENRRASYTLQDARLEIDTWPHIPPYLEIEADTHQQVLATAQQLGYTEDQLTGENTTKIYTHYGIDLTTYTHLAFNT